MVYAGGSREGREVQEEDRSGRVVTNHLIAIIITRTWVIFVFVCKYNKRLMVREFTEKYGKSAVS